MGSREAACHCGRLRLEATGDPFAVSICNCLACQRRSGLGQQCPPTCTGNTVMVNPDTGDHRMLASQGYPAVETFCSLWSPDATRFACEGGNNSDPSVNGIYTIRSSDGGGLTRLTNAEGGWDIPLDSPDGTESLRPLRHPEPACERELGALRGHGRERVRAADHSLGLRGQQGNCSPDGSRIAFEHRGSLVVVHPDGSDLEKMPLAIDGRSGAGDFAWSPDGARSSSCSSRRLSLGASKKGLRSPTPTAATFSR